MRLPTSVIVIITILILAIVVLVIFFTTTAGVQMTRAEADNIFATQCLELCPKVQENGIPFLMTLSRDNPRFIDACKIKYGTTVENECIGFCGKGCAITATPQQELCAKVQAMPGENCADYERLQRYRDAGATCAGC